MALFGSQPNPASKAMPYVQQIPGVGQQYYGPYVQQGQQAGSILGPQYESLVKDPTGFIESIMKNYAPSSAERFNQQQLTSSMENTARAGGIAGTPYDQMQQAAGVQGLLSKDEEEYLRNALGVFGTGLTGEESIYNKGYDASKSLADLLSSALNEEGSLAFQGQRQENQNRSNLINMFAKLLSTGAGVALGGPFGGAAGYEVGNKLFNNPQNTGGY